MDKKSFVVSGECSESSPSCSDAEEELLNYSFARRSGPNTPTMNNLSISKGKVFVGEAPESDEELEVIKTSDLRGSTSAKKLEKYEDKLLFKTLLHKKLRESNYLLHRHITRAALCTALDENHIFHKACQQLIDSQVLLQEAISSLNTLHNDTVNLTSKISSITTASFLPNIIISADGKR